MSDTSDKERAEILKDREYQLLGQSTWIDVRTLTVNIRKYGAGIKVEVWPKELLRGYEPIATIEVPFRDAKVEPDDSGW